MPSNQKVFNIGLPKTGTSSLAKALEVLGIKCLHNPHHLREEVMQGNFHFDSSGDWQAICNFGEHFYPQLDQAYLGSKFILTERDLESWLKSIEIQISRSDGMAPRELIRRRDLLANPRQFKRIYDDYRGVGYEVRNGHTRIDIFGCFRFHPERFSYVYDLHARNARDYFANRPDDFLVMNVVAGDGWEKLCAFLDCPLPDGIPFPFVRPGPSA